MQSSFKAFFRASRKYASSLAKRFTIDFLPIFDTRRTTAFENLHLFGIVFVDTDENGASTSSAHLKKNDFSLLGMHEQTDLVELRTSHSTLWKVFSPDIGQAILLIYGHKHERRSL